SDSRSKICVAVAGELPTAFARSMCRSDFRNLRWRRSTRATWLRGAGVERSGVTSCHIRTELSREYRRHIFKLFSPARAELANSCQKVRMGQRRSKIGPTQGL